MRGRRGETDPKATNMIVTKLKLHQKGFPWLSWFAAILAAYVLKRFYSQASAGDLAWILAPTARLVGWMRGETLIAGPAGWAPAGGSYVIAPACAGVNFMILALTVSVLGFSHRLASPGRRLAWCADRQLTGCGMDQRTVDDAEPRRVGVFERPVTQQVDHARHAARKLRHGVNRVRRELDALFGPVPRGELLRELGRARNL